MWSGMPFVRIIIPYIAGIWCASSFDGVIVAAWASLGIGAFVTWLFLSRLSPGFTWHLDPLRGLAVLICIFTVGGLTLHGKRNARDAADRSLSPGIRAKGWICTLDETPQRKQKNFRATASIDILTDKGQILPGGQAMIYFPIDSSVLQTRIGSRLITTVQPDPMKGPEYPGGFDPATYFGRQGIGYRIFLKPGDWLIVDNGHAPQPDRSLERIRTMVLSTLARYIPDREALGLAEALLIGYRNDLDERISDAYAETGVIHVIAISGLHIGVIFSLLSGLLHLLIRGRKLRWGATGAALAGIWGFGLLAGGGPSVMRSVCMFSIISIGRQVTGREGGGLNTLAAVAGLMLSVQPWWLFDLGFQLSFAAVAGLMIFYQPVLQLLPIRNPLALKLWEMIAVTLAAQVLTTPLLLHTFGRFPLFFLITNIVAIPLSTVILLGEIALCLLAPFHDGLAGWCGQSVSILIHGLNTYIFRMESIPFGTLENIHLTAGETTLIYLTIACFMCWGWRRTPGWLMASLISLALVGCMHTWMGYLRDRQQLLVVMPLSRTRLIMLIDGSNARWLMTPFGPQDRRQVKMAMRAAAHHFGINRSQIDTIPAAGLFRCTWNNLNLWLMGGQRSETHPELKTADFVILSGNGPPRMEKLMAEAPGAVWIADGTNRLWKILQWETAAERLPLRLISTRRSGAFIHRIR